MARVCAGDAPFPLQVGLCELGIKEGHLGGGVAQQFHERLKADAGAEHFRGVGMPEHVGDDEALNTQCGSDFGEFGAKLA